MVCDVKSAESLQACVDSVLSHFGQLDILVNNAQEVPLGTLDQVSDDSFAAGWQSGPLATFRLMKICRPHLAGGGCIVNLASSAAKRWDMSGYGAYAATKEAMKRLTRLSDPIQMANFLSYGQWDLKQKDIERLQKDQEMKQRVCYKVI